MWIDANIVAFSCHNLDRPIRTSMRHHISKCLTNAKVELITSEIETETQYRMQSLAHLKNARSTNVSMDCSFHPLVESVIKAPIAGADATVND
jgi:hypothetical protein